MDIFNWLYSLFFSVKSYPFMIQVSLLFISMSCVMSVFFLIYLTFLRIVTVLKDKKANRIDPEINTLLKEILFEKNSHNEEEIKRKFDVVFSHKKRLFKFRKKSEFELIINILVRLKNTSNQKSNRYYLVVKALGIDKYLESSFSFSSAGKKKRTLQYMSDLEIPSSDSRILSYTYSSNSEVKNEARLSYLNLSKNDPYRFFDEIKGEVSNWEQIKLMNLLIDQSKTIGLPNFGKWIGYSENDSLVTFLIKSSTYFNQKIAIEAIRAKISHPNHLLRSEAITALGKLKDVGVEKKLKAIYNNQPNECQWAIVSAIGYLNTGDSLAFLESCYKEATTLEMKKNIAMVIYDYGKDGSALFQRMKLIRKEKDKELDNVFIEHEDKYEKLIFSHIENDLILYK